MDLIRSCHSTTMKLWGPEGPDVPVKWFFTTPGAAVFSGPCAFRCVNWAQNGGRNEAVALLGPRGAWFNGRDIVGYPGDNFHGPAEAFERGGIVGVDEEMTTNALGALDACMGEEPMEFAIGGLRLGGSCPVVVRLAVQMQGGIKVGGEMPAYKLYQADMDGGIKAGGEMPAAKCYRPDMEGGIKAGGECPVSMPGGADLGGGIKVGGTMEFRFRFVVPIAMGLRAGRRCETAFRFRQEMGAGVRCGGEIPLSRCHSTAMDGGCKGGSEEAEPSGYYVAMDGGCKGGGESNAGMPPTFDGSVILIGTIYNGLVS